MTNPVPGDVAMMELLQKAMVDAQVMAAAETMFGVVVTFLLVYLILERKKDTLIVIFLAVLLAFGGFYWWIGKTPDHVGFEFQLPVHKVEQAAPDVAPAPVCPPTVAAVAPAPAKKIVRKPKFVPPPPPVDLRPICSGQFSDLFGCRMPQ